MSEAVKKLQYENEKLLEEIKSVKIKNTQVNVLSEENFRKKIKRLTGELDMFDSYILTMKMIFESLIARPQSQ